MATWVRGPREGCGDGGFLSTCSHMEHHFHVRIHECDKMLPAGADGLARSRKQGLETASERPPILGSRLQCLSREVATGWLHVSRINQGPLQADCDFFFFFLKKKIQFACAGEDINFVMWAA